MMEEMEYLRLPSVFAKQIQHPEEYIKKNDPKDPQRRIFKNVPISQDERKLIQSLKEHLQMHRIDINPESQTDEVLLRYLYACQLNLDQTKDLLRGHLTWLKEPKNYEFDQDVLDIYNKGIVYLLGRDKQHRPTLIINCEQINTIQPDLLTRAISILCIIMEDYCFYDGKVENWNVIVDLKEKCVLNVKLQDYYQIFLQLQQNFPCTVDKIFVLHPSMSVQLGWGEFMEHVSNKKKIIIVSDYNQFKKYYEPTQMERKYGGRVEIKKYFPPLNTLPEGKQLTEPLKLMETITQMAMMPQQQSVVQVNFEQSQKLLLQPQETMKVAKSKIDRDFSVYPQQEVNDFTVYRPTEIVKEPIRNISKYNRLTQAQQMKEEYEYQIQQQQLQQKQSEIMKTKKVRQSQFNNNDDFEEVLSEQIVTQTYKPQQPTTKSRLTADQVEEDNAACNVY